MKSLSNFSIAIFVLIVLIPLQVDTQQNDPSIIIDPKVPNFEVKGVLDCHAGSIIAGYTLTIQSQQKKIAAETKIV